MYPPLKLAKLPLNNPLFNLVDIHHVRDIFEDHNFLDGVCYAIYEQMPS
jgi:hypothetical protein